MKTATKLAAERELRGLLDADPATEGMTLRAHGKHFILGREDPDPDGPYPNLGPDDRVRLTHMGGPRYGLSFRRHTGRWEKTPFSGTLPDLVDTIAGPMQHLVAAW
ncbi:hypothetical protein OAX78_03700 [Planctomycetota bacterium]|nr:hypothetical protein [Planctomycetota bacterium]